MVPKTTGVERRRYRSLTLKERPRYDPAPCAGLGPSKTFIGKKKVTTGSDGKAPFIFSPALKVGVGKTVTATGSEGTSEFSAPKIVAAQ
jgi:hypothetical protein